MDIQETKLRSFVKAIILRFIIFTLTLMYILFSGGTFIKCIELSILDVSLELITHYIYERVWQKISWGISIKHKKF